MKQLFKHRLRWQRPSIIPNAALLYGTVFAPSFAHAQAKVLVQRTPVARLNLRTIFPKNDTRLLGLTPYGTAILVADIDPLDGVSSIARWNIANKKVTMRKPLSKWFDPFDFEMSANGSTLATNNQRTISFFPHVQAYRVTALRTSDFSVIKAVNLSGDETTSGYLFPQNDSQHIVMKSQSIIPIPGKNDAYFGRDRFEWLNLKTGKRDKVLRYNPARGCDKIVFSPDKKYLLCLFQDGSVDTRVVVK